MLGMAIGGGARHAKLSELVAFLRRVKLHLGNGFPLSTCGHTRFK